VGGGSSGRIVFSFHSGRDSGSFSERVVCNPSTSDKIVTLCRVKVGSSRISLLVSSLFFQESCLKRAVYSFRSVCLFL